MTYRYRYSLKSKIYLYSILIVVLKEKIMKGWRTEGVVLLHQPAGHQSVLTASEQERKALFWSALSSL